MYSKNIFSSVFYSTVVALVGFNVVNACRLIGEGCTAAIVCCDGLSCVTPTVNNNSSGFCQLSNATTSVPVFTLNESTMSPSYTIPTTETVTSTTIPANASGSSSQTTGAMSSSLPPISTDVSTFITEVTSTTSTAPETTSVTSTDNWPPIPSGNQTGDGTYYDCGLGACGWVNNNSNLIAAVSWLVYGNDLSLNQNAASVCGKCALVMYGNNSVKVELVDKCMGCQAQDIDMSPAAFSQLTDLAKGRISVTWYIVSC